MRSDRHRRSRLARLTVAVAAAAATVALAAPAHAGPDNNVSAFLDDVIIGADGSPGKAVPIFVSGLGAVNPVLTVDVSGLDGVATADFPDERCDVTGSKATCSLPDTAEFFDVIPAVFRPIAGVTDGDTGTITYSIKADNLAEVEQDPVTLTVKDGVDLVAFSGDPKAAKPGDEYAAPIAFGNFGNQTADAIDLLLFFSHGVIPDAYANCQYGEVEGIPVTLALCRFEGPFEADGSTFYEVEGGFGTVVAPDALGLESVEFFVSPTDQEITVPQAVKLAGKGGEKLTLTAKKAPAKVQSVDIDDRDNYGFDELDVENSFDLAAIGANVTGAVGDVVKTKLGVKNTGAGSLDGSRSGMGGPVFTVAVPAGAEVVKAPDICDSLTRDSGGVHGEPGKAGGTYYRCTGSNLIFKAGDSYLVEFGLKIKSLSAAPGAVSLDDTFASESSWNDDNDANNTAPITVGGGSGGGDGDGGTGGGLPVTGVQVGAIAGGGAALLAIGVLLFLFTRRRRVVMVADDSTD